MYIRRNVLQFVNDNAITIVDSIPGVTEHVEVIDNVIENPVTSGIFFGADGEPYADVTGMSLKDVTIGRNRIEGFFASAAIFGLLPPTADDIRVIDNVIHARRATPILDDLQHVQGILIRRGNIADIPAARDIHIEHNTIVAMGEHAQFNEDALRIDGPMSNVTIANNTILCEGCGLIQRGISLRSGSLANVTLRQNTVDAAVTAFQIGQNTNPTITVSGSVVENTFLRSKSTSTGQINVFLIPGSTADMRIADNQIHGGEGVGILCEGAGTFLLSDLVSNQFENAGDDISGCL
jgi:hypothetical protein